MARGYQHARSRVLDNPAGSGRPDFRKTPYKDHSPCCAGELRIFKFKLPDPSGRVVWLRPGARCERRGQEGQSRDPRHKPARRFIACGAAGPAAGRPGT